MTVEVVAQQLGVTVRTLHYYEEVGLINEVPRTAGGHRLYDEETIQRLDQILKLRDVMGYSLQEIREIMQIEEVLAGYRETFNTLELDVKEEFLQNSERLLQYLMVRMQIKINRVKQMQSTYEERIDRVRQVLRDLNNSE